MDAIQRIGVLFQVALFTNGVQLEFCIPNRLHCKFRVRDFSHGRMTIDTVQPLLTMYGCPEFAAANIE
jgi:hypothetical protein